MNWGDKRNQLQQRFADITRQLQEGLFRKWGGSKLEPTLVSDWFSRAFQNQGASFYGGLATIVICSYFLSNVTSLLAGRFIPEPPIARPVRPESVTVKKRTLEDFNVIMARNLFSSEGKIPGEENATPTTPGVDLTAAPVRTSLPFNLIGTVILRDELKSIATIEDKTASMVYPVRIDDEIPGKARIIQVEARKVIFVNLSSNRKEFVDLPEELNAMNPRITLGAKGGGASGNPSVEQVAPNQYNIARTEVDKAFQNINEVLTQARAVPNFENGVPAGYKLFQIVPGSIYAKLGFQDGDVISGFDGQAANDPAKALEAMNNLRTANHAEIQIKRNGRPMNMVYDIR